MILIVAPGKTQNLSTFLKIFTHVGTQGMAVATLHLEVRFLSKALKLYPEAKSGSNAQRP